MSPSHYRSLPGAMQAYVAVIVAMGLATVTHAGAEIVRDPKGWPWMLLAILTLASGSATVRLPSLPATISISETFVITAVLLYGPAAGTIIVALDAFVISFWTHKRGDPLYKVVFNVCALPLSIWLAAHVFFVSAGVAPFAASKDPVSIRTLLLPLALFTSAYFLLNSWLIAFAIALEKRLSAFAIWRDNLAWLSLNYFGGASVAALLVSYTRELDFSHLAVIIPLLIVIYFTFSMAMGRVEDANKHVRQLNTLYMSTIETLAMAIDAKDQITHGHIRRVQSYAVALAKGMGVSDEALIRAVEAAALLHDMGKLAVPEYILNKPGPLTPAEFEKMKLHASVGADILSAIEFPYPVVPIVRHHHENWDGTGYPDRLAGSTIPIGARILSVVDCFDALTSDRPYRPRLADKEALRILVERRGTMYDPLVVDTFLRLHPSLVAPTTTESPVKSLTVITRATATAYPDQAVRLEDINASAAEAVALFALSRAVAGPMNVREIGAKILSHVRPLIPHSTGVLFTYREDTDELTAVFASGDAAPFVMGLTLPLGQRLSGWVGANRKSIRNSDPVLDIGDAAKSISPRPRSCLSTSVVSSEKLGGVLTLYSVNSQFFTEEHQRILEAVASQIAPALRRAIEQEHGSSVVSAVSSQPPSDASEASVSHIPANTCLGLIEASSPHAPLSALVLGKVKDALESTDFVFRRNPKQVAILFGTGDETYARRRLARVLQGDDVNFVVIGIPQDGDLEQLLASAEQLLNRTDSNRRSIH